MSFTDFLPPYPLESLARVISWFQRGFPTRLQPALPQPFFCRLTHSNKLHVRDFGPWTFGSKPHPEKKVQADRRSSACQRHVSSGSTLVQVCIWLCIIYTLMFSPTAMRQLALTQAVTVLRFRHPWEGCLSLCRPCKDTQSHRAAIVEFFFAESAFSKELLPNSTFNYITYIIYILITYTICINFIYVTYTSYVININFTTSTTSHTASTSPTSSSSTWHTHHLHH